MFPGIVPVAVPLQKRRDAGDAQGRQLFLAYATGLFDMAGLENAADRAEAVMALDLGPGRLPALLVLGSEDPHQFTPQHGTDLLSFFAGVFERALRKWLA